jgi:hypothetical protein
LEKIQRRESSVVELEVVELEQRLSLHWMTDRAGFATLEES